jgi:hypothetical protein
LSVALSTDGELERAGRGVRLTKRERDVVALLLAQHPEPIGARELARALGPCPRRTLSTPERLMPLRRRLTQLGLSLRCRPGTGYTLERADLGRAS